MKPNRYARFNKPRGQSAVNYANRGKPLEMLIETTNVMYTHKGWADIQKAEPPVKVQNKVGNKITLGWYQKHGFVDYFGVSHGRAIAFEAKTTNNRTAFALSNVKDHQVEVLKRWHDHGAASFVLVDFEKHDEVYLLWYKQLEEWWEGALMGGRKSIPYEWFHMNCQVVKSSRGVALDYLYLLNLPG